MYEKLFTGKNLVPDCKTLLASVNTKKNRVFVPMIIFLQEKVLLIDKYIFQMLEYNECQSLTLRKNGAYVDH